MNYPLTSKKTTKHKIPHPKDSNCVLTGVLEQLEPEKPTHGRRIALLLHGTIGHKDYLFLKRTALRLSMDSFRFDFRGNFESPGPWRMGGFVDDVQDIEAVVAYLTSQFGYVIDVIIGHSRGVVAGLRWMCTAPEAAIVRGYVNASGRYRMRHIYETISPSFQHELDTKGFFIRKEVVARQPWEGRITKDDMEEFATFDSSLVWTFFPDKTHVLTIHGMADQTVPPYDATIYADAFGSRGAGAHSLCYIEKADHNFTGRADEVAAVILDWLTELEAGKLKTGVWPTGVREHARQVSISKL